MSALEILAVIVSFLGIWLTMARRVASWPVNLLACALYFKLFFDVRLYADMTLQALFGVGTVYGWIAWKRGQDDDGEVVVMPLRLGHAAAGLLIGAIGAGAIGLFTSHYTNASLPWMDSTLTSFSLVASFWAAQRHAANWLLWIVVDAVYVGVFVFKELLLTAGLYAAMILLATLGYSKWTAQRLSGGRESVK